MTALHNCDVPKIRFWDIWRWQERQWQCQICRHRYTTAWDTGVIGLKKTWVELPGYRVN